MKAKICSGDSEQTTELQEAVKKYSFEESKLTELNRTCAKTNNVVLSLLRVQEMTTRMNTILNQAHTYCITLLHCITLLFELAIDNTDISIQNKIDEVVIKRINLICFSIE